MKLLWAAAVVVHLVSSSVGSTVPEKDDFFNSIGLKDFQKDRNFHTLFYFLEKASSEYVKIILLMLADWSAAIPEPIAYLRKPLVSVGKLVNAKEKSYIGDLNNLADSTKLGDKNEISEGETSSWGRAALSGFKMVKAQLEFENLKEKDFPSLEFVETPTSEESSDGFHYQILELFAGMAKNIETMRSYLNSTMRQFSVPFMFDKPLLLLADRIRSLLKKYGKLFISHKEELSHYVVKKNNTAYKQMSRNLSLFKELTYFIAHVIEKSKE